MANLFALSITSLITCATSPSKARKTELFTRDWRFVLGDVADGQNPTLNDSAWRALDLPHDWSIEGTFSKDHPATPGGGALPGGIGWYRKTFVLPETEKEKAVYIAFDGIYRNGEVWINGHYLGRRPYGYSSFRYTLTPYLHYGSEKNVLAVRVDNSRQPNSRWYSGSGIYRNVWLTTTQKIAVDEWGTFITVEDVSDSTAKVIVRTTIRNLSGLDQQFVLKTTIVDSHETRVTALLTAGMAPADTTCEVVQKLTVRNPRLWSIEDPHLYKASSAIECNGELSDEYETTFGIRTFAFDEAKGFLLNGKQVKIKGVCNHHDLGCLGSAVNSRALQRQLEILKAMGCNGIRTSHNPPAPELLDLCDEMGFIVMDEAFDMWKNKKTDYDYALDWDEWFTRDLEDMVRRDRNHPSVFIWSIGNEVQEQWDKQDNIGVTIARTLASIVKGLDPTRMITSACNSPTPDNPVIISGALDLIGYNYHQDMFPDFPNTFPGKRFIGSEVISALATRGHYDMPSDSIRRWPKRWDIPLLQGNPDNTCSSYDNCSAPWGSTHEETWKIVKKYDFLSGMYVWTGFDYLGEPTPYGWPSRSSYFGIVDLAGFPKDAYYLYQSEWTDTPVLHLFPHWNWTPGKTIDVWAYTNCEEVELFLNGQSQGIRKKSGDDFHVMWRLKFAPGTLKAVGRTAGQELLTSEVKTSGVPARLLLQPDRALISADGRDLSFVTVRVVDDSGTVVPQANNLVHFSIAGAGKLVGVDNGLQTSAESFQAPYRRAFNGKCLAVIQSTASPGQIVLKAISDGLKDSEVSITSQ